MSSDYVQVNNLIENITKIYSNSYKPFIKLKPERYINTEDLIQDLKNRVPRWDGHASFTARNSFQDNSAFRINSFGNGYIFVSKNAKLDNIYRFYSEIMEHDVKEITLNLISFEDKVKYEQLLCYLIMPFAGVPLQVVSPSRTTGELKMKFDFDPKKQTIKFDTPLNEPTRVITISRSIPGIKVNLMLSDRLAPIWYQRLRGTDNYTIYSYSNCDICKGYLTYYIESRGERVGMDIFSKFIVSTSDKKIPIKVKELHKRLRPLS